MGNDIFTPFKQHSSLVSRISLAYFKDTNHEDIQPFCDTPEKLRCLSYEKAIGTCTMWKMYRELSSQYQYMDDTFEVPARYRAYYSGSDLYDYCPVYERPDLNIGHFTPTMNKLSSSSNKRKRAISQIRPGMEDIGGMFRFDNGRLSVCKFNKTLPKDVTTNLLLEDLGPNTACFDHSKLIKQNVTSVHTISRSSSCHKFECSTWKGLQITVNEQKFPCSTGSNTANVTFTIQSVTYSMTIFCPPCRSLC
ncbi:Leishmanolysin-like peptidase [Schistosoma japonicum]|nr:Leishmanolysin-like peptidase [Schistosoma japonicum]